MASMINTPDRRLKSGTLVAAACAVVSLWTGTSSAGPLTFSVSSGGWPDAARRQAAVDAMTAIIARFNAYGDFSRNNDGDVGVVYGSGTPTADATYNGQIRMGGTYPAQRVMQHEFNHWLGSGTAWQWNTKFSNGIWVGPQLRAIIKQLDGDSAEIHQSGVHFYGYGLNYDSEVINNNILPANVAVMYAMRQDMGIGAQAAPWSATTVTLKQSDKAGVSGFNRYDSWDDGYFAHPNAAYYTSDFQMRTPLDTYNPGNATPSFTFRGTSLSINNTNGASGGLLYVGKGTASRLTFNNLILDGGYVKHGGGSADLFQINGKVTLGAGKTSTVDAANGNINVLADVTGSGSLNVPAGSYAVTMTSGGNNFTGGLTVGGKLIASNTGTASSVNIASTGTFAPRGAFNIGGALTSAGTLDMVDTAAATVTAGALNLNAAKLNFQLGSSGNNDKIVVNGAAAVTATNTVNLSLLSGQSPTSGSSYTLIDAAGGSVSASNFVVGARPASLNFYTFALSNPTAGKLAVTLTGNPTPATAYWTGDVGDATNRWGSGDGVSNSNWATNLAGTSDAMQVPGSITNIVFNASNATGSSGLVKTTLDAGYIIKSLSFDSRNAAVSAMELATNGNRLSLSDGLTLASTSTASALVSGTGRIDVNGDQSWANNNNAKALTVSSGIASVNGAATLTLNGTGTGGVTLSGAIADGADGPLALVFNQAGTTTLSAANTYSGPTAINSGTVSITSVGRIASDVTVGSGATLRTVGGSDAIGDTNAVVVQAGGTFDVGNTSGTAKTETIGSLAGAGTVTRSTGGSTTLMVGVDNTDTAFTGQITNGAGTMALAKTGSGQLTLGGSNSYSGGTTVATNGGSLLATNANALGSGNVAINGGTGTLQLAGNIALATPAITTVGRPVADADSADAASIENVSGNNTINGAITFNAAGGTALNVLSSGGTLTLNGPLGTTLTGSRAFTFYGDGDGVVNSTIANSVNAAAAADTVFVQKDGNGRWTLNGDNTFSGGVQLYGGTLAMGSPTALGTIDSRVNMLDDATLAIVTDGGDRAYNLNAGSNQNSIGLASGVKTGGVGINHTLGTMSIGINDTVNITADASVTSGKPSITLTAVNFSSGVGSGPTTFNPTTADAILGSVTTTTNTAKTLVLDGTSAGNQVTGAITNGANVLSVRKSGTSTWTLSGTNTYTGGTTVNGGTLRVTGSLTGATTVNAGGVLDGTGSVTAVTLNVGGKVSPGISGIGTLSAASLVLNSDNVTSLGVYDLDTGSSLSDRLTLSGALTKGTGSTYLFDVTGGLAGQTYSLITYTSTNFTQSLSSTQFALSPASQAAGYRGVFSVDGDSVDFRITTSSGAVPEPASIGLLALAGTALLRRRRRAS